MNTSLASFTHLRLHVRTYAVSDSLFPYHGQPLPGAANSTRSSNTVFVYEASQSRWQYPTLSSKSSGIIPATVGHKCIYCFILNGVMSFPCLEGTHDLLVASTRPSYWRTNSSSCCIYRRAHFTNLLGRLRGDSSGPTSIQYCRSVPGLITRIFAVIDPGA
jgi:hypothetical protein